MRRRQLLTAVPPTVLGGCMGSAGSGDGTTRPTSTVATPRLTVTTVDRSPVADTELSVTVTRQFTANHPGEVSITFANTGSEERSFSFLMLAPFPPYDGRHVTGDGLIELVPQIVDYPDVVPDEPAAGCWQATSSAGGVDVPDDRRLGPDQSVSQRYTLLSAARSETCLPDGAYRFEKEDYASSDGTWGFTITVGSH